jgi:Rrf2 family protein
MGYLVRYEGKENLSLQPLASHMDISPTYLSKILTQLVKAGLIQSTPGVNGGYSLRKKKEDISFLDVIWAIEGSSALFTCEMGDEECCFQKIMEEAENKMESYLQEKTIYETVQNFSAHKLSN